jgi:hypothetical protein
VARLQAVHGEGIENYMKENYTIDPTVDTGPRDIVSTTQPVVRAPVPVPGVVAFMAFNCDKYFTSTAGYSLEQHNFTSHSGAV